MQIESGYRTDAVSPRNAQGLMQLIPDTAERFGVKDPFDAKDNMRGGMRYLRWLLAYFQGDVSLVAAAYNAGEGAVERYRGVPPYKETETYVKRLNAVYPRKRHPFESRIAKASEVFTRAEVAELD
jgi:soluble lytic murein transglycosylase-like protein